VSNGQAADARANSRSVFGCLAACRLWKTFSSSTEKLSKGLLLLDPLLQQAVYAVR
jgi:hypothetical protein